MNAQAQYWTVKLSFGKFGLKQLKISQVSVELSLKTQ